MKNIFFKTGSVYLILTFIFTSLMIAVHCIPRSAIIKNAESSIEVLQKEGLYKDLCNIGLFKLDNYTDALMLQIAILADNKKPIESAMLNNKLGNLDLDPIQGSELILNEKITDSFFSYGRYWHGNQLFLRPLLTFLDYNGIRILNYILFTFLIVSSFILINRTISKSIAILFLLSLLMVNFSMIPLSMQFSACFYIALISIVLLLGIEKLSCTKSRLYCTFFVIGACTSFFDLLTTPIITLGLPLIFYTLKVKDYSWQTVILVSVFWGLGYASLWATKWLMVSLLTDYDILKDAIDIAKLRSSNVLYNHDISIYKLILGKPSFLILGIFLISVFLLGLKYLNLKNIEYKKYIKQYSYLLLIFLMTPAWYIFMLNHSLEHHWFTWRAILVSLLSLMIFIYEVMFIKNKK